MSGSRIAMLIPYFGHWPEWMPLYLYTCSRNPQVDFHYFTDCGVPEVTYGNTIFHPMTFEAYLQNIERVLGVKLPNIPSKLCDIKPFYGIIHRELLDKGAYTWWGFGDLDVAYGDLSSLTSLTSRTDLHLITTHIKCISGHFTLIRTDVPMHKTLLPLSPQLRGIIEGEAPGWVDERQFSDAVRPRGLRTIDRLWYSYGRKIGIDRNGFYHAAYRFYSPSQAGQYYCEPGTTFTPSDGEEYLLNLNTLEWALGKGEFPEHIKPGKNLPYLHFLMFKKISYNHTGHYWTDGFYQIPKNHIWTGSELVEFTTRHIRLK